MKFVTAFSILSLGTVSAFSRTTSIRNEPTALFAHHQHDQCRPNPLVAWASSLIVGATIFATQLPETANAIELSSGAFSIQSSISGGENIKEAGIDGTVLLKTLFKNRKDIGGSLERIQNVIKEEVNSPVWNQVKKEVLQIEGDITSDFKISPPSDITQTIKDVSNGKLNFILNGEVVNVAIDTDLGKDQDEVVIKITGVKVRAVSWVCLFDVAVSLFSHLLTSKSKF